MDHTHSFLTVEKHGAVRFLNIMKLEFVKMKYPFHADESWDI